MSQTSESKVAGMWRPAGTNWAERIDSINKYNSKIEHKIDGEWYVLDQSSEAQMEAANLETIGTLEQRLSDSLLDNEALEIKIDRLTADLAAVTKQRDRLLQACVHARLVIPKEFTGVAEMIEEAIESESASPDAGKDEERCSECGAGRGHFKSCSKRAE